MKLSDYDFDLPEDRIAAYPADRRDESRLLVLDRVRGAWSHRRMAEFPAFLAAGDLLVVNNTRVLPARVFGRKASGGRVELLFVRPAAAPGRWLALANGGNLREGTTVDVAGTPITLAAREGGAWEVAVEGDVHDLLERAGELPLPPYIVQRRRSLAAGDRWEADRERYQTVFAAESGAVAAPTAGLHFTPQLLETLTQQGVERAEVTLHVGPGTFLPVRSDDPREHRMHAEEVAVGRAAVDAVEACRARGGSVVAVGTTVVRTLEGVAGRCGGLAPYQGDVDTFILPGHRFQVADRLLTNFHLPRSTLLMLVAALTGRELLLEAYRDAVREGYRFYSYGDAMLVL